MDKRVVLAVAGSGKTKYIIDNIEEDTRALILTYTDNNLRNLKTRVLQKFGKIPEGLRIYSYYTFLYTFCFRPIIGHEIVAKGINWDTPPAITLRLKRNNPKFYIDSHGRLYHNRIAKLLETRGVLNELFERLEKYFDYLFVDEIQDFGGHDINLIYSLVETNINVLLVGDFYQHTFDTSRDGNVNSTLHNDYTVYKSRFKKAGYNIDSSLLSNSYRSGPIICQFLSKELGIKIDSHRTDETSIEFIDDKERANRLFECCETVKLFYQSSNQYSGLTENWGASKGQDCYNDVCIVLNSKTLEYYKNNSLRDLPSKTKNKLYVACTRAKGNLYLVPEKLYKYQKK
jgi:DNA helicase II / ATP-dependent DNA helicase PcrA